jgi:hypothetical protein
LCFQYPGESPGSVQANAVETNRTITVRAAILKAILLNFIFITTEETILSRIKAEWIKVLEESSMFGFGIKLCPHDAC